jgi:DNA-binding FadR family transcriptional regulator
LDSDQKPELVLDPAPSGRGTRTLSVYQALLSWISEGRFQVDDRLPSELELAKRFSVSRPVIRNALARLRDEGLVRSFQGSGTVLLRRISDGDREPMTGHESVRNLQRCFEFRGCIEGEAAHAAATRYDARSLERIASCIYANGDIAAHVPGTIDFHQAVAAASDNPFLVQALEKVQSSAAFSLYLRGKGRPGRSVIFATINAEHLDILRLIERRRAEDAREAMRGHIRRANEDFIETIPLADEP